MPAIAAASPCGRSVREAHLQVSDYALESFGGGVGHQVLSCRCVPDATPLIGQPPLTGASSAVSVIDDGPSLGR
jgi:hypothetical protein